MKKSVKLVPPLLPALLATSCAFAPADFTVAINQPDHTYTVRIYDPGGLVESASPATELPAPPDGVTANPESKTLEIRWVGGDCKRTPLVHLEGTADALTVTVEPDATDGIQLPLFSACDAVGILLGVTVSMKVAVSQASVTFVQK